MCWRTSATRFWTCTPSLPQRPDWLRPLHPQAPAPPSHPPRLLPTIPPLHPNRLASRRSQEPLPPNRHCLQLSLPRPLAAHPPHQLCPSPDTRPGSRLGPATRPSPPTRDIRPMLCLLTVHRQPLGPRPLRPAVTRPASPPPTPLTPRQCSSRRPSPLQQPRCPRSACRPRSAAQLGPRPTRATTVGRGLVGRADRVTDPAVLRHHTAALPIAGRPAPGAGAGQAADIE